MNEENQVYFVDSDKLPAAALERKHRLEDRIRPSAPIIWNTWKECRSFNRISKRRCFRQWRNMTTWAIPPLTWSGHFLMTPVRSRISRRFYLRLLRRTWSRWQGKRRRLPRIISEIRSISLHRCISQIIARITVFTADSTVTTISGGKS